MRPLGSFSNLLAAIVLCAGAAWANNPGIVQGVVKSTSGQPVAGAHVRLTSTRRAHDYGGVSGAGPLHRLQSFAREVHGLQAVGGELQSKTTPVDVTASKPALADSSLTDQRVPELPGGWRGTPGVVGGGEVWSKTPRPSLPDGPGKEIAQQKCGQCHAYSWFLSFRAGSRDDWANLIDSMRSNIAGSDGKADDFSPEEISTLADYFWNNLKKPSPWTSNSRLPRTLRSHRRGHEVFRR